MKNKDHVTLIDSRTNPGRLWSWLSFGILGLAAGILPPDAAAADDSGTIHALATNTPALWRFTADYYIETSPALGADGTLYFASSAGTVYAVNSGTGAQKWQRKFAASAFDHFSSPALGPDGTVYVGTSGGNIRALVGTNGAVKWTFATTTTDTVISTPTLGLNNTLYVGGPDGFVYALAADSGQKLWEFQTGAKIWSSASLSRDDTTLYIGSCDYQVYALDAATGAERWRFATGREVWATPTVGDDGTVYVGAADGVVYALHGRDGVLKWSTAFKGEIEASAVITPGGLVIVGIGVDIGTGSGQYSRVLAALDKDTGELKWLNQNIGGGFYGTPALSRDGLLYVGTEYSRIRAVNCTNGVVAWQFTPGGAVYSSPVIGPDGTVYIGSEDRKLYALKSSGGPGQSPWPKFKGNAYNDGRQPSIDAGQSFTDWANALIPEADQRGLGNDPDADGLPNAVEFATGGDPTQAENPGVCRVSLDSSTAAQGYLILAYPEAKNTQGVQFEVQTSPGLPPVWTPLAPLVAEGEPQDLGSRQIRRVRVPLSSPTQSVFVRVTVTVPQP